MSNTFNSEKRDRRPPKIQDNRKRISHSNTNGDKRVPPPNVSNYTDRQFIEDEWLDDQE